MSHTEQPSAAPSTSLVERCRRGDRDAWNELVETYSRYVYAIIGRGYRLAGPDAEDVFQDVFARVFERLETLRDDSALQGWISQVTRNLCLDHIRRERSHQELTDDVALDERLSEIDEALSVRQAMSQLSHDCYEILDRFFCRDESYRSIGTHLGIPAGTIASRISRCLGRLRDEYGHEA
jgi:RNA polymerase sigma-70 factor (ECF subfamily)